MFGNRKQQEPQNQESQENRPHREEESRDKFRMVVWGIAALYILYTGIRLVAGYFAGGEGAEGSNAWANLGGGILFLLAAVLLLITVARYAVRVFRETKADMERIVREDAEAAEQARLEAADEEILDEGADGGAAGGDDAAQP